MKIENLFDKALKLAKAGKLAEALKAFEQVLKEDPSDTEAYVNIARIKGMQGDHEDEAEALRLALENGPMHPKRADIWNDLGYCYEQMDDMDRALEAYRKALECAPEDPSIIYNLAGVLKSAGNLDEAIKLYERSLKIDPDDENGWVNLGIAYFEKNDIRKARTVFRKAVKLQPDDAKAWYDLALTESQIGISKDEIACYRKALAIDPDIALAWFNLGVALEKCRDLKGAKAAYMKAFELEPDDDTQKAIRVVSKKLEKGKKRHVRSRSRRKR